MTVLKWGSEQLVNTTTSNSQFGSSVAALADGGFVIVWIDASATGGDTSQDAIRMQRFDAFGNKVGPETLVNTTTLHDQTLPAVAVLGDGSFFISWSDGSLANGTGNDVRFRHFAADGTPIDSTDRLAVGAPGSQSGPDTASFPGGFVMSYNDSQSGSSDIFAQRFDATGTALGGAIPVRSTADVESGSAVATLAGGGFVVAWGDTTSHQYLFQRFTSGGATSGGAMVVTNVVGGNMSVLHIAALENGSFLITWPDSGQPFPDTTQFAVRAQLYDAAGTAVGGQFTINTTTQGNQSDPNIVAMPGGGFAAVWQSNSDIHGQIFDPLGARVGTEFAVNTGTVDTQLNPSIEVLADGRLVVVWTDLSALSDDTWGAAVRMQIIDPREGSVTGTNNSETLLGNDLVNDEINGLGGNDLLNGLAGGDFMYGGDGDDTYFVDNSGDRTIELPGRGTDLVKSSISFVLPTDVENLTLFPGALSGTGNSLANTITGNAGANTLNGLAGADTMLGLAGNDTYVVDDPADVVSEAGGSGIDTVRSGMSFSLVPAVQVIGAVENLTLTGAAAINGIGNTLANAITGNTAANVLSGGGGNDKLAGGLGNDRLTGAAGLDKFVFETKPGSSNRDVVTDFNHVQDTFLLDNAVFTKLGAKPAERRLLPSRHRGRRRRRSHNLRPDDRRADL